MTVVLDEESSDVTVSVDEAIMLALTAGASARLRPNNWSLERPDALAYLDLVDLFSQSYGSVDARMMEAAPGSKERQRLLAEQIAKSGAASNPAVLRRSRRLLEEILRRTPQTTIAIFSDVPTVSQALLEIEKNLKVR